MKRRRFLKGAGAVTLGSLAGCTYPHEEPEYPDNDSDDDSTDEGEIEASEPIIDESIDGEVSEEFIEVLEVNSFDQKHIVNRLNEALDEGGFSSDGWYDVESLNNTVYPGGALQGNGVNKDATVPGKETNDSVEVGDDFVYVGEDAQKNDIEGFDILTTIEVPSDTASMSDITGPDNGRYLLSVITEPGLAFTTHRQLYSPIRGQMGEKDYNPEAAEEFEKELAGIGVEIRDYEDSTAELYIPGESEEELDVEYMWEKVEESIESPEEDSVREFRNDLISYTGENVEYSIN